MIIHLLIQDLPNGTLDILCKHSQPVNPSSLAYRLSEQIRELALRTPGIRKAIEVRWDPPREETP